MKVVEWNINHRLGHSRKQMPIWVKEIIKEYDADISVLTECSDRVSNWKTVKLETFPKKDYYVFSSQNDQVDNNDIVIAIKKENIEVLSVSSLLAEGHKAPDHLQIKCKQKETDTIFVIVGIRIHAMNITDQEKQNQLQLVLNELETEEKAIIVGDFNCNRRSFTDDKAWNLNKIDSVIYEKYKRVTPEGASWARDVCSEDDFCFALDHFIIKGINKITSIDYNRTFVNKDAEIYKWGKDFQAKLRWDKEENKIPDPYPDHAILSAEITIDSAGIYQEKHLEPDEYPINEEIHPYAYECPKCNRVIANDENYSIPDMCDECSRKH